jgi:hypothetical protein
MKRCLCLLPFLFTLGCHTPTPRDESFVAFVSAKTFIACDNRFLFSSDESNRFCSCLAKQVASNTRGVSAFNRSAFVKAEKNVMPSKEQVKECLHEVENP